MASQTEVTLDNTVDTTAKEGIEVLEKTNPVLAEKCQAVMKEAAENGAGDAPEIKKNGDSPIKMPKDDAVVTANEGEVNGDAKTEAQETEVDSAEKENDEKLATKRSAEDAPEQEVDEAKKQKTEEPEESEKNDSEKESAPEEATPAE